MATKKSNEAKVTAWTGTMKAEMSGSISACAIELFNLITTPDMREKALKIMTEAHERMKAKGQ